MAGMLMDYQSLMVTHVNTSGHMPMDHMMMKPQLGMTITVHVLLYQDILLLPL